MRLMYKVLVAVSFVIAFAFMGATFGHVGAEHNDNSSHCSAPGHIPDGGDDVDQGHDTFQGNGFGHCTEAQDGGPPPIDDVPPPSTGPPTVTIPPTVTTTPPGVESIVEERVEPTVGEEIPPVIDDIETIDIIPTVPEFTLDVPSALPNAGSGGLARTN